MVDLPRGTVTLLFTDIEGSTQLLRRLGDAYANVLAEHQRLLREAFAAHGGREVDTQGDAFFVAFPRAVDAVRAAVAAQRALAAHPWPAGGAVRVRMGLHTGEPAAAGGRYVGLAVHRAARVGSAGHGGQVLLSETTHSVLRDQLPAGLALRDLGEHRLKDFDQPEHLYQLVIPGLPADFPPPKVADPAPLPPLSVPLAAEETPLVGRERELGLLRERLGAALAGRGGLVLVGGEAGVGKTTLAEALAREALDRGARVALGRCYDLTETPPYGPWREALAAIPAAPDLPPLPAALGGQVRGEAVASQEALFARAHAFLAAAASARPLVLLLDDLHWADPASLDLLRFLARQLPALPLLLVVTYRADELTRRHPLYQLVPLLVRESRAIRLDLRALPEDAVRELVRGRYGLPDTEERRLAAYLRDRAEGHPLFVGELLRTLEEEGALHPAGDGWQFGDLAGVRVPRLLRQVIEGRLDRLGEEDQRLLAVAAVIGQEVPLALWAAVAGTDEEALYPTVERAVEARLLAETPDAVGVRFTHGLIREALYEGTLPLRRRGWHRRIGEALAGTPGADPDALAYHFRQAGDPRAAEWLVRAGERAQRAYAWLTAAERYEAALALLERHGAGAAEVGWLHLRLGLLRRYAALPRALAHLERAAEVAGAARDPLLLAHATFNRGLLLAFAERGRAGLAAMEAGLAALAALPAPDPPRLARLRGLGLALDPDNHRGTLALRLAILGHYARARAVADDVAGRLDAVAHSGGLDGAFAPDAWAALGHVHVALGQPEEARRALGLVREAYQASDNHWQVGLVSVVELQYAVLAYQADRLAERRQLADDAERAWARAGVGTARAARLWLLWLEGRWAEAGQVAQAVVAGQDMTAATSMPLPVALDRARGEPELAQAQVRAALPAGPATAPGDTSYLPALALQRLAAELATEAGDLPTARAWLEAHDRWLAWGDAVLGRAEGALGWAQYHRAAGGPILAREHAERALARASEPRQPLALLAAHRSLGELDTAARRYADAAHQLDQALALAEACAAPYERALTLLALSELRAATGNREEARALLDETRAILAPLEA